MMKTPPSYLTGYETQAAAKRAAKIIRENGFRAGVGYDARTDTWVITITNNRA